MSVYFHRTTSLVKRYTGVAVLFISVAFLFLTLSAYSQNDSITKPGDADSSMIQEEDSVAATAEQESMVSQGHSTDEVKRGKRFFLGILPFEREHQACVSCHNITPADTLNWNPSAYDIALKYADKDFASFQQAVMQPSGQVMSASHQNFDISEKDLHTVKLYLDHLADSGLPPQKPSINKIILFLILGIIITWALLDLIIFHKIKYKIIPVVIFLGAFGYQVFMIYGEAIGLGRSLDYQPEQPVKFSHEVHVTQNQIDCMYCHHTATHSKSANIPSTDLCMNCHVVVREGTRSGKFEISKVVEAHEEGRSIEWIRIHDLPDHVFFSHAQHVGAGKLDCAQCHGEVEEMHVVRQVSDLSMSWCLECHRETNVDFLGNDYYKTYERFHDQIKAGIRDSVTAAEIGANSCQKCHY
ncbi:MAG: cytochrome c3 family protein [Prolixibacteraceae bacterium]